MTKQLIYSDLNPISKQELKDYQQNKNTLTVIPYYKMKESFRDRLLAASSKEAVSLNNIISITHLLEKLYYKVSSKQIIEEEQLSYLLYDLLRKNNYQYFDQQSVSYILEFILQVDANSIDLIAKEVNGPLQELITIYQKIKESLIARGLVTKWQACQDLLAEIKQADFNYVYPEINELSFYRLQAIKPVELNLILKLAEFVEDTAVVLDYNPDKDKLFANLKPTIDRLKSAGFKVKSDLAPKGSLINDLFNDQFKRDKYNWQQEMGSKLEISSYQDKVSELKATARKIVKLAKDGQQLDQIGVAFSDPKSYLPHLARVFSDYNLSYQQEIPVPLLKSTLLADIKALLKVLRGDFNHQQLLILLTSNFFTIVDSDIIDYQLRQTVDQMRFDLEAWQLVEFIIEKSEFEELQDALKEIQSYCKWDLEQKLSSRSFIEKLEELLTNWSLAENLIDAEQDIKKAGQSFKEELISLVNIQLESRSVIEWIDLLNLVLKQGYYIPDNNGGVKVTGNLELRNGEYDYVFLLGMSDDLYPTVQTNPLNKYCNQLGIEDKRFEVRDRYLLNDHLLAANQGIYITYSKSGNQEEAVSSSCLEELKRVIELEEIEESNKIYSELELQQKVGADLQRQKLNQLAFEYQWSDRLAQKAKLTQPKLRAELEGYNGNLQAEDNLDWLKGKFNDSYNYSASLLESYLTCPFQFLLDQVFNLGQVNYEEEMNPLERGSLLHQILDQFYSTFAADRITEENYEQAYQCLLEVSQNLIADYQLFNHNFYWQTEGSRYLTEEELGVVLEEFLEQELKGDFISYYSKSIPANEFRVQSTEWEFHDLELIPGCLFTGKVDRIDYHPERDVLAVIDYKTGKLNYKTRSNNPIQLPLYLLAVAEEFDKEPAFGAYFGLHPEESADSRYKILFANQVHTTKAKYFADNLAEAKELMKTAIEGIRSGEFGPREDGDCSYCDYFIFCQKGDN